MATYYTINSLAERTGLPESRVRQAVNELGLAPKLGESRNSSRIITEDDLGKIVSHLLAEARRDNAGAIAAIANRHAATIEKIARSFVLVGGLAKIPDMNGQSVRAAELSRVGAIGKQILERAPRPEATAQARQSFLAATDPLLREAMAIVETL